MNNFDKLTLLEKKDQYQKKYIPFNFTDNRSECIKRKGANTQINFNRNKKSFSRKDTFMYYCIIIKLIIFSVLFDRFNQNQIKYGYSSIRLKTNRTGEVQIFSTELKNFPDEIWINDLNQSEINIKYNLINTTNYITLIWHDEINDTSFMFNDRSEITEIDFSNFTTSNVINMYGMFYGCTSLDSLDLSNFDTSNVIDMGYMFYGCTSLNSLNLANFNTSNVEFMDGMFDGCSSLNSLDLSNFNITNYTNIKYMFYNCSNLEYINLQNAYIENSTFLNSLSDNVVICSSNNMIFDNTSFKNILINCIGKIIEDEDKIKCYSKKKNIYNNNICQNCGHNFYPIYNNSDININCIETMNNHCVYYYYFNITSNIFYCTNDKNCPNDYNKLVPYRNECIINCENEKIYKYEYDNICYNKKMNQSMNDMIKDFKNEFNKTDIDNGHDKTIIDKNIIMIFTSTQNQKDNENISNLTMNLGQCENTLKNNYNISNNNSLYMLLVIHEEDGKKIPKVEYEIYYPLSNNNNLTKLDMNYCQGTKIEISIGV